MRLVLISDDVTGALDSAVAFMARGLKVVCALEGQVLPAAAGPTAEQALQHPVHRYHEDASLCHQVGFSNLDIRDVPLAHIKQEHLVGGHGSLSWREPEDRVEDGHAIRELMDDRNVELLPLEDIVEVDEAYVGGAPKSLSGAYNPPGKGTEEADELIGQCFDET